MFPKRLIPEPKGFDDPLKQRAAMVERKWEAAAAAMGAGAGGATAAVAVGIAIPPVAPVLAAGAAIGLFAKLRAKWLKDDPPRLDYETPPSLQSRRIELLPLLTDPGPPLELLQFLVTLEACGRYLEVTVEAMEKALGAAEASRAGDERAAEFVEVRSLEAQRYALSTSYVLEATGEARGHRLMHALHSWLSEIEFRLQPVAVLWEAVSPSQAGKLLAAGIDEQLLSMPLGNDFQWLADLPAREIAALAQDATMAGLVLAEELRRWVAENGGPEPLAIGPNL